MRLQAHPDAQAFIAATDELLSRDEARHNLIYGICSTLIESPSAYEEAFFWTVEEGGTLAALLRTPPYNIAVAQPRTPEALDFAAEELRAQGLELPGVSGALPEADIFASAWEEVTGTPRRVRMAHGVYAAHEARVPGAVPGELREAEVRDRHLAVEWIGAFQDEAFEEDTPRLDLERWVDRRIESRSAGLALWEVDAEPVSLCGYGGRTPHGIRIGPVYTPPEHRRHGYAGALTARVTQQQLESGRDYCFLYTDLANPTSNRIYMNIGYERVCDAADYAFDMGSDPEGA